MEKETKHVKNESNCLWLDTALEAKKVAREWWGKPYVAGDNETKSEKSYLLLNVIY